MVRKNLGPMDMRLIATLLASGFHNGDAAEREAVSRRTRAIILDGIRARPQ